MTYNTKASSSSRISQIIAELKLHEKPWLAIKDLPECDKEVLRELSSAKLAAAIDAPQRDRQIRRYLLTPSNGYRNNEFIAEKISNSQDELAQGILSLLQKNRDNRFTYEALSEKFDRSTSSIKVAVQTLADNGYQVAAQLGGEAVTLPSGAVEQVTPQRINFRGDEIQFGVVSDTHLGSKECKLDMLHSTYDLFEAEGVTQVLNCGDLTEGPGNRGYNGHVNDVLDCCQDWRGLEAYTSTNYPMRDGIHTYCISSSKSHDGWEWNKSGRCPTADVCNGRTGVDPLPAREDMTWLGHDCADVTFGEGGKFIVRIFHPDGGGAYSVSYKLQKFIEAMPGGTKPNMLFAGHLHQECIVRIRNVIGALVPGMQGMTPLFRRFGREPIVGAYLVNARLDEEGSLRSYTIESLADYFG